MTQPNPPALDGLSLPPQGRTRLVTRPGDVGAFTGNQETDARLAITRGLAEYLEQMSNDVVGGRQVRFRAVREEWAEPEEKAIYPSAVINLQGPGVYAARSLTPSLDPRCRLPLPDGRYLIVAADYQQDLGVEVWATDPEERTALVAMLERSFNPLAHRYGFVLELPHYFNSRATYSLKELALQDSEENALRRYRIAIFTVSAVVPVINLFSFPDARPLFELQAVGPCIDVVLSVADS